MKKMGVFCLIMCMLLQFFCACGEQEQIKEYLSDRSPLEECVDNLGRNNSGRFLGTLPSSNVAVPTISLSINETECSYNGTVYKEMVSAENPNHFCWSGWQLDCDYLEVLGRTAEEEIVYGIKDGNEEVVTLLILDNSEVPCASWFALPAIADVSIANYSLEDFYVQKMIGEEDTINTIDQVWFYHTSAEFIKTVDPIIEWPEMHRVFLICKEIPWLVYELNYSYRHANTSDLFVYSVQSGGWVMLDETGEIVSWLR